ncbi:TonB-dependent receptor [Stenotrophomonas sp.]|jgi:iron complex outermembrane receptor protein|uniref:TonB-dependent receptor n=1 Tax=Stenotrophomonas TaxID=40323 RepID=UPI0025F17158|nr:TonB-dependent receptor [Stenotrophomonas sp.]MBW8375959.1 TonB-dependent receptor [Stenotrophomonas sp.]
MIKPLSAAISTALFACVISPAMAQSTTPTDLDQVIVTGSRTPISIEKVPGAVTVVNQEQVQRTLNLTEDATAVLARMVPGYSESSQAMSNSGETLRGRVALRLFDGVPQGSPLREGSRNGTFTDMGVIGRIEVINGPSAAEGIGGAGGVINYLSKNPEVDGHQTTVSTRYGTQFKDDSGQSKIGITHTFKGDAADFLISGAYIDRGIAYDGDGRRVGLNTSGSLSDSYSKNLFLKGGYNFGEGQMQRIQASYSNFHIGGKHNYIPVEGCRYDAVECPIPSTNTAEKGSIKDSLAEFNDFEQFAAKYTHADFFGGDLSVDLYWAKQAMRYVPENGTDRQLVKPAPPEADRIWDQSEINSEKKGLRLAYAYSGLFAVEGLRLRTGLDLVEDTAEQRLALTDRVWVPPMKYTSLAPYAQLSWDIGPVTLDAGIRREDGELEIDGYTTTAYRDFTPVQGGKLDYKANLPNFGAIWRISDAWSVFASYSEGFGIANVGIPLRNIQANSPCKAVSCIADLQPLITKNKEVGFNWRGEQAQVGISGYRSTSEFGSSLTVDKVTEDFILTRAPTRIEGIEMNSAWTFNDQWKATLLYSRIRGQTQYYDGSGLNKEMGILDISPDKVNASLTWTPNDRFDATLGVSRTFSRDLRETFVNPSNGAVYLNEEDTYGYALWDLSMNYDTGTYGKLSLGIENLLDKQYVLTWSQLPGWQNFFSGRGRMVSLTHTFTF